MLKLIKKKQKIPKNHIFIKDVLRAENEEVLILDIGKKKRWKEEWLQDMENLTLEIASYRHKYLSGALQSSRTCKITFSFDNYQIIKRLYYSAIINIMK